MFFSPLGCIFILLFFLFLFFLFLFVQINAIALVFAKIGIPNEYIFSTLFAVLMGSFINIPVKRIPSGEVFSGQKRISYFGFHYVVPLRVKRESIIAVNVGGAIIPTLICIYLLFKTSLWWPAFIATAIMTLVLHRLARPIPGLGIAIPAFLPPLLAAFIALIVSYENAPVVAYISGTLGTLIGADLMNLKKIPELGAPVASIGGAGTFDGIFLNGFLAVLLAVILA